MNTPVIAARRFFTAPWLIGIVLGCLALIALGLALAGATPEQPATDVAQHTGVVEAFQSYRAGEWRAEEPARTWPSGWAEYRAGEWRAEEPARTWPSGWAEYRAGERAPR